MKCKVYMRVAKTRGTKGYRVWAGIRPNYKPLMTNDYHDRALPTATFALELDIPEEVFRRAEQTLAEIELRNDDVRVAAEAVEED